GWSADAEYKIDNYVIYKNKIYRNITGEYTSTNPAEDTTNWREASVYGEINNNYQTFLERLYGGIAGWTSASEGGAYKPNAYVMYKNQLYRNTTGNNTDATPDVDTANWEASSMVTVIQNTYNTFLAASGAKDYEPGAAYSDGEYVVYNNIMYKNVANNAAAQGAGAIPGVTEGEGQNTVWIPVSITEMIDKNYETFTNAVGAEDYNNSHSYQAGDYVIYNGKLYRAKDATSGSFSSDKWEAVTITEQVETLSKDLEELEAKTSLNNDQLKENLENIIEKNMSLDKEQKEAIMAIINSNDDVTKEGLTDLHTQLKEALKGMKTENTNERNALLEQLEMLENNTASYMNDYEKRIKMLEDKSKASTAPTEGATTSGEGADFDFGYSSGAYGYWADGIFHPL
nr:hypothetical protein [Butyrivibrio sp.]